EKSKHRYKIEAKNSELKNVHGYNRAIAYGIENMQMQGAMAIFAVNLKRILKLI
ncbi:transposase, partial [Chryseobacterium sp. Ch-15]